MISARAARGFICVSVDTGGEGGIRTHEALANPPVFKTGAINRSATSPFQSNQRLARYSIRSLKPNSSRMFSTLRHETNQSIGGTLPRLGYRVRVNRELDVCVRTVRLQGPREPSQQRELLPHGLSWLMSALRP